MRLNVQATAASSFDKSRYRHATCIVACRAAEPLETGFPSQSAGPGEGRGGSTGGLPGEKAAGKGGGPAVIAAGPGAANCPFGTA